MISVKGGSSDYNIVKDTSIKDLLTNRNYVFKKLESISDTDFYNKQIFFYYQTLLDCNYKDNQDKYVEFYTEA